MLMTRVSEGNIYDFDVAVSFAGDDHELAEEVVNQLRVAGLTVDRLSNPHAIGY